MNDARYDPSAPYSPAYRPGQYATTERRPLSAPARVILILFGTFAVCCLVTVSALAIVAHSVMTSPLIRVHVQDRLDGTDFHVVVPSGLVTAGLRVAPWFVPDDELDRARVDLARDLEDLPVDVRRLAYDWADTLAAMPDATLVEVEDGSDRVWVEKRGDHLLIQVDSVDADVEVEVPIRLLHRALDFIEV